MVILKFQLRRLWKKFFKTIETRAILYQDFITYSNFVKTDNLKSENGLQVRKAIMLYFSF